MHNIFLWVFILCHTLHSYLFGSARTINRESNQSSTASNKIIHFCRQNGVQESYSCS